MNRRGLFHFYVAAPRTALQMLWHISRAWSTENEQQRWDTGSKAWERESLTAEIISNGSLTKLSVLCVSH